ncbi:MAG: tetratricopeptide repeat protein, partial [Verrucomicrobiota bacterium]
FRSPVFVLEVFKHTLFPGMVSSYYRPVQNISYMLDYWFWNRNAFGYHLSNVLFHAASAFLLYLLLKKLLPALLKPDEAKVTPLPVLENANVMVALIALVWVIHPIHNAAVAYIAGRADSLAALFALSAWLLWIGTDSTALFKKCLPAGLASMALLLLALCSKEIALVWIALFLFHLLVFERGRSWTAKIAACCAIAAILTGYWFLRNLPVKGVALNGMPLLPMAVRAVFSLRALGDYCGLIFFPAHLQMERAIYNSGAYGSLAAWQDNIRLEYLSSLGLLTLLAALYLCWKKWPGQKVRIFGAGWFLIGFLPISNLFPLNAQCAEHWIYMPSIGFLVFLAGCVAALPRKICACLAVPFCLAVLVLGVRTWIRSGDWVSAETFFKRTIEQGGGTCRIQLNLADIHSQRGDWAGAEKQLRETVSQFPGELTARIHLGRVLMKEGKTDEARLYLSFERPAPERTASEPPKSWKAAQSLATLKQSEGKVDEGIAILDDALVRYGDVWELTALKAQLVIKKEGDRAGIAIMQRFADDHWWHYGAYLILARLQERNGEIESALAALQHAAILDIHASEPLSMAAQIELDRKNLQTALDLQQRAIRRDPSDVTQLSLLAKILKDLGRKQEASDALKKILDSAPD